MSLNKIYPSFLSITLVTSTLLGSTDLHTAIKNGKVSGQVRYYYMQEDNQNSLRDYFGSAIGGKLKYETASLKGLKAGIAFYTTNFLSDNIDSTHTEPTANNKGSRYVIGLMDASNPDINTISGVGEAYISYLHSKTKVTFGRMKLKTPFMNPEDGRMIPTLEQGLWIKSKDIANIVFQAGYINAFWNRSTSDWKSVKDSIGYGYGQGLEPLEKKIKGNYYGNISSDGLYVISAKYVGFKHSKLQVWNYYAQNLFNLAYFEGNYNRKVGDYKLVSGLQYINEKAIGEGGNSDPTKAYMRHGERAQVYGGKVGVKYKDSLLAIAYNYTTKSGRFIFPREWGKEPFYTFQKRERSEGSGGAHAWLLTLDQNFGFVNMHNLNTKIGYGRYYKPDVYNHILNKYGLPSYAQMNIDIFYSFRGYLKGLKLEYLLARKYAIGNTYQTINNSNFVFGKVNMTIHNLILNYTF